MSNLPSTQVSSPSGSSSNDSGLSIGGYGGGSGGRPSYSGSGSSSRPSNFGGFSAGRGDDYPSSQFMPSGGQRDFEFKRPQAVSAPSPTPSNPVVREQSPSSSSPPSRLSAQKKAEQDDLELVDPAASKGKVEVRKSERSSTSVSTKTKENSQTEKRSDEKSRYPVTSRFFKHYGLHFMDAKEQSDQRTSEIWLNSFAMILFGVYGPGLVHGKRLVKRGSLSKQDWKSLVRIYSTTGVSVMLAFCAHESNRVQNLDKKYLGNITTTQVEQLEWNVYSRLPAQQVRVTPADALKKGAIPYRTILEKSLSLVNKQ